MKYTELSDVRKELDSIDEKLVELFVERMELCSNVAEIKIAKGLPLLHSGREQEIIDRLSEGRDEEASKEIEALYKKIFEISRQRQTRLMEK